MTIIGRSKSAEAIHQIVNTTSPAKVLLFDSGFGGLSVAAEIRSMLPGVDMIYFADNAFFPYGSKTADELLPRVREQLLLLQIQYAPDIIVLACNTASTLVLKELRACIDIPIVGVVPAVKPAAETSQTGIIGLLGTPGTVLREYTAGLIEEFAGHCTVISIGTSELATMAEAKIHGLRVDQLLLHRTLAPFKDHPDAARLDTIVLACTHFPLLRIELQEAFGRQVSWLDSGTAIARRVRHLLADRGGSSRQESGHLYPLTSSAPLKSSAVLSSSLAAMGFEISPAE